MKRFKLLSILTIFAGTSALAADNYAIDTAHSQVIFKIKHLGISTVVGRFDTFKGDFMFDTKDITKSAVNAEIDVTSINTNETKRDDHLRGDDFFAATKFPKMTFTSKSVEKVDDKNFKIHGLLKIKDISKPVTLSATFEGAAKDPFYGKEHAAFIASTEINRKDYGLTWNKILETGGVAVGDEVKIEIQVEGTKQS
ncbi:polyisoprenoid-binding protein [bacterium]|nr:polyisoprenoid-binding protein [bacterium]